MFPLTPARIPSWEREPSVQDPGNVHMVTRRYQSLTETPNLQGYSYFNGPAVGLNEKPNSRV
ncbi:hypothetical protein OIPHN260_21810 [Enterobacter roggenkampii]|uniref:Uncharacterized protein n=1 Tax=Enterobacter roggenkampii TaxID=1812935 RepID=A0AAU9BN59_9ENTR|nr:hypothetical protein OIPHN260_21810 [Enterobacter roggenkampii]